MTHRENAEYSIGDGWMVEAQRLFDGMPPVAIKAAQVAVATETAIESLKIHALIELHGN